MPWLRVQEPGGSRFLHRAWRYVRALQRVAERVSDVRVLVQFGGTERETCVRRGCDEGVWREQGLELPLRMEGWGGQEAIEPHSDLVHEVSRRMGQAIRRRKDVIPCGPR